MGKTIHKCLQIALLMILTLFIIDKSESNNLYCCNYKDPRDVTQGTVFSYFCGNPEIEVTIGYWCCYDIWRLNGWNPPIGLPCPPYGSACQNQND